LTPLLLALGLLQAQAPTNPVCPVMGSPVGPRHAIVTVKGRPYRVCCKGCQNLLTLHPQRYLDAQGNPKAGGGKKGR
jgi:hypothetical protein